ncbi:MAG: carbon-nitrogen hydrolase family protein, partial [Actinomycetia bacterium]|nr:carbon-nitrogen hydrolase family protein [Actinomycetes bacterium]
MKTEGKLSIGIVQYTAAPDPAENWQQVLQSMHSLHAQAADMIVLPEAANVFGTPQLSVMTEKDDYFVNACCEFANSKSLHVYLGSAILRSEKTEGRQINRSLLIDGSGEIVARYDKIHMFDANPGDGVRYLESEKTDAGEQVVTHKFAYSGGAVCFGMTVCYDLRFPELFKTLALAGA